MTTSSFSYKQFFHGNSVMIIVPHEDDEINMAGATIWGALQEGLEVRVVFLTNGDYEYPFDVRRNEVYQMAKEIGLAKENIIFLGFGDFIGHEIIYDKSTVITSHANHNQTYGADFTSLVMSLSLIHIFYELDNRGSAIRRWLGIHPRYLHGSWFLLPRY